MGVRANFIFMGVEIFLNLIFCSKVFPLLVGADCSKELLS